MRDYIYPGHPITIAVAIMEDFTSLSLATEKGHNAPKALESSSIPGAGGNVYSALDILKRPVDESINLADDIWRSYCSNGFMDRYDSGVAEATALLPRYKMLREGWANE
jgi:hypothetical protein